MTSWGLATTVSGKESVRRRAWAYGEENVEGVGEELLGTEVARVEVVAPRHPRRAVHQVDGVLPSGWPYCSGRIA